MINRSQLMLSCAIALCAVGQPAIAQTDPTVPGEGDAADQNASDIIVTAKIAFRNRTEDANPVLSYDLEYFQRFEPVSVGEMLKRVPGVTFTSDVRDLLPAVTVPSLIVQCTNDALAPLSVGEYLHAHLARSELVVLSATGHVPQVSAPAETAHAVLSYVTR